MDRNRVKRVAVSAAATGCLQVSAISAGFDKMPTPFQVLMTVLALWLVVVGTALPGTGDAPQKKVLLRGSKTWHVDTCS